MCTTKYVQTNTWWESFRKDGYHVNIGNTDASKSIQQAHSGGRTRGLHSTKAYIPLFNVIKDAGSTVLNGNISTTEYSHQKLWKNHSTPTLILS